MNPSTDLELVSAAPLADRLRYAEALAGARLLPGPYRRSPADVLLAVELADALGLRPIVAINGVHVVDGRPTMSAELMRALVLRAGHRLRVIETTSERCVLEAARRDRPEELSRFAYTLADAERAGLLPARPGTSWDKHPGSMLLARASSAACRAMFPDVLAGVSYTPEELGAPVDALGAVVVGELVEVEAAEPAAEVEAEPESIAGIPRPGTRRRSDGASAYASVRAALGTTRPGDVAAPTDAQIRAVWARLREAGAVDEVHARWALAAAVSLEDYPDKLGELTRFALSRFLDLGRDEVTAAVAATAGLAHPDDEEAEPVDVAEVDPLEELEEVDALEVDAAEVDGPPRRPRLSTDEEPPR